MLRQNAYVRMVVRLKTKENEGSVVIDDSTKIAK